MTEEKDHQPLLVEEPSSESVAPVASFDVTKLFLPVAILIAAVMVSGTLLYVNKIGSAGTGAQLVRGEDTEPVNVTGDDDPVLGRSDAPVTIVEFSDFQCPFCRRFFEDALVQIKKEYVDIGKVRLVYRDFPLDFHPGAQPAAMAAECADEQGKFWEFHDKVFAAQALQGQGTIQFGVADLKKWAKEINLNTIQFNQCLDSGKYKEEVAKDQTDGTAAGVSGTPTLFINGIRVVGAQPFATFKTIIDKAIKDAD